ncbi:hypothetical protein Tco_0810849 [Tanacetum coccineum]
MHLLKTHFKDFIPMDSEKEREMLKEREAKRLLRKRKATIAEEQPSKKPKLRTETIDELRNYLRIIDASGDTNHIWETAESSDDDFWKDQIEDARYGNHMLAERRYPLSREVDDK